jgi:hypothetical protein
MGALSGIFVAEEEAVEALIASGKEVYFGEVLGKHSEKQPNKKNGSGLL